MTFPTPLTCAWSVDGRTGRLTVSGDLDYYTADTLLEEATAHLIADRDLRELLLDCADLGFCDSHGLSVLVMTQRRAAASRVPLRLVRTPHSLARLLELTGLAELFGDQVGDPLRRVDT